MHHISIINNNNLTLTLTPKVNEEKQKHQIVRVYSHIYFYHINHVSSEIQLFAFKN